MGLTRGHPDDRVWRWVIWIALVLFGAVAFYGRQRGIHWGGDDADYVLLARGLRDFRYHDAFLVGTPPHITYPPFYPLLLALWGGVFGSSLHTLAALNVLFMLATLGILAHLARVHGSARFAAVALLVVGANPRVSEAAGRLLAEAPMMFLLAAALWFADRRRDTRGTALAIACAVLCALTRTAGVAAIGGIGAYWLLKRRFRAAVALAVVSAVFLGAWFLWTTQDSGGADIVYVSRFRAYQAEGVPLWRSFTEALMSKATAVLGSQMPDVLALPLTDSTRLDNLAWTPLSLGAVAVGLVVIARQVPVVGLFLAAYAIVLAAWPFSGARLLVPVIPALSVGAVVGAERVGRVIRPWLGQGLGVGVAALLVVCGIWKSVQSVACDGSVYSETPDCVRESELALGRAIAYLGEHAPADAVVMARRGEVVHFYTGHLTAPLPSIPQARAAGADSILARAGADYILASQAYVGRLPGLSILLDGACERLEAEFEEPPHTLLLRVRPPVDALERNACDAVRRDFPVPRGEEAGAEEEPGETG